MTYDIDFVKNVLKHLKEDPMRITYTEHYLEQIEKRDIQDVYVTELLENKNPNEIHHIQNSRFELHYILEDSSRLQVTIDMFNRNSIILISAIAKKDHVNSQSNNTLEFEGVYDLAFDMIDFRSKTDFRYGQSIEMETGFNIDFDSCGHPVAVEMLRVSKKFKIRRNDFSRALFDGTIEITPDIIRIRLKASFTHAGIEARVLEKEVANDYGIASNVFDLKLEIID